MLDYGRLLSIEEEDHTQSKLKSIVQIPKKNIFTVFSNFLHHPSLKPPNYHHGRFIATGATLLNFCSSSSLKSPNNHHERSITTWEKSPLIDFLLCGLNVISLPNVQSKTMTKVIKYSMKHLEDDVSKDMLMNLTRLLWMCTTRFCMLMNLTRLLWMCTTRFCMLLS